MLLFHLLECTTNRQEDIREISNHTEFDFMRIVAMNWEKVKLDILLNKRVILAYNYDNFCIN